MYEHPNYIFPFGRNNLTCLETYKVPIDVTGIHITIDACNYLIIWAWVLTGLLWYAYYSMCLKLYITVNFTSLKLTYQSTWVNISKLDPRWVQIHSKYTLTYTSKYIVKYNLMLALKDTPNWTHWHTPSHLDCTLLYTLPVILFSTLSSSLPIALDGTVPAHFALSS